MSIQFESEEAQRRRLREHLRGMNDEQLIRYGLALRHAKTRRVSGVPDRVDELAEARAEWLRRHPASQRSRRELA